MDCGANTPRTGVPWLIRICVDRERAVKLPVAACEPVMVAVPVPTTLIVFPEIVATFVFDEVKTHGAGELVVGGTIGTEPTPYVAVIIGKGPRMVNVACAGANEVMREMTRARLAYTYDLRGECILSLSSMFTGFLGYWHLVSPRAVSQLIVKLIAMCAFGLRLRAIRRRLKAFFGVGRGHQCSKCVFMVAADKAWSQPLS